MLLTIVTHTPAFLPCLTVLSLCVLPNGSAQVVVLNDDVVRRTIPVLRVDAAQAEQGKKELYESKERSENYLAILENIKAGKADPLPWLKTQSRLVLAPPSAAYQPAFSQAVSAFVFLPIAVFSFGIFAPNELVKTLRTNEGAMTWMTSGRDPLSSPAGQKLKALSDRVEAFYLSKKFSGPVSDSPFEFSMTSPDSSLLVIFNMCNSFPDVKGGEKIGDGPILLIQPGGYSAGGSDASSAQDQLGAALKRAGLSREQYDEYFGALVMAKSDAANPEGLELKADLGENDEASKVISELKEFYALRKKNVAVYQRYAQQLDPLLATMGM